LILRDPSKKRRLRKTLCLLLRLQLCLLFFFTLAPQAAAHDPFELTTSGNVSPAGMTLVTTATRGCAVALLDPHVPRGTAFAPEELPRLAPRLEAVAAQLFEVTQNGRRLAARATKVELTVEAEVKLTVVYPAPAVGPLVIVARHVQALGPAYASALTLTQDEPAAVLGTAVFTHEVPELVVQVLGTSPSPAPRAPRARADEAHIGLARTFMLGVEHILLGFDHLLFLAGLLITCRRARSMLVIVTSFTVAHSITLVIAALEWVILPASLVEPLIAASIVLVGVENLVRKDAPPARAALCFAFGLVHGFGFAGALRELGLGRSGTPIALPLLGFNLGVEAGQLLVVAVLLPALLLLRRKPPLARWVLPAASVCVVAAGAYWLLDRTLFA
jgi:hydrogenase/urease accessory protein HupE